jgi:hypothetical protein
MRWAFVIFQKLIFKWAKAHPLIPTDTTNVADANADRRQVEVKLKRELTRQ